MNKNKQQQLLQKNKGKIHQTLSSPTQPSLICSIYRETLESKGKKGKVEGRVNRFNVNRLSDQRTQREISSRVWISTGEKRQTQTINGYW